MILDEAIKRAKVLADFNRRLAARYTQENNIKPDPRKAQEADTYANRALALDTVIAAAQGAGIDEKNFAPVAHGKWIQSKYVRSLFICSVCSKSTDVTFNGRNKLYAYCPHCGARMDGCTMTKSEELKAGLLHCHTEYICDNCPHREHCNSDIAEEIIAYIEELENR